MSLYEVLVYAGLLVPAVAALIAFRSSRDALHPLVVIAPMFAFIHGWMPYNLLLNESVWDWFERGELTFVQFLYVLGMVAFFLGCLQTGCPRQFYSWTFTSRGISILRVAASICATVGAAAWLRSLMNVGGFQAAFGRSYGGGWDDSGYIRDAVLLLFPAAIFIIAASRGRRAGKPLILVIIVLLPWIIQGSVGARRSAIYMSAVAGVVSWVLYRRVQVRLSAIVVWGVLVGYSMLFVVANRDNIYVGSDKVLNGSVRRLYADLNGGNEYIYGSSTIIAAMRSGQHYWGKRYAAYILVRPIPKELWPTKYEDFGVPELRYNAGTLVSALDSPNGRYLAIGAAPGGIADLWIEFRWISIPALFLCGYLYGRTWVLARTRGGLWIAQYVIALICALFFTMQTLEAVIFRFLILSLPVWIVAYIQRRSVSVGCTLAVPSAASSGFKGTVGSVC